MNRIALRNFTIVFGGVAAVASGVLLSPIMPEMAAHFSAVPNSTFLVKMALIIPSFIIAISAPFIGAILDRIGRKPILTYSLIVYALSGASGYFAQTLNEILLGRVIMGLSVAGLTTGFTVLIADYFEGKELNKYMGYQGAAFGIGGVLVLLVSGYLADFGWRYPFLLYLLALGFLPGVIWGVDEPKRSALAVGEKAEKQPLQLKTLLPIYILVALAGLTFFIFPTQIPFILNADYGVSNSQVGIALSLQTVTSILAALTYQRLRKRFSFEGIVVIIFVSLGINHALTLVGGSYSMIVLGLMIGGIGLGLVPPNSNVWITSLVPETGRARALAGIITALFAGQSIAPFVVQAVSYAPGSNAIFIFGVLLSLVIVITLGLRMRKGISIAS